MSEFFKKLKLHELLWLKFVWRKCWKVFLEAIFSHLRKLLSKFSNKIFTIISCDIIVSKNFLLIIQNYDV